MKCWFWRRGETGQKPLSAEKRSNKLNPHLMLDLGIKPGPHWWEASALTTLPSLHPMGFKSTYCVSSSLPGLIKTFSKLSLEQSRTIQLTATIQALSVYVTKQGMAQCHEKVHNDKNVVDNCKFLILFQPCVIKIEDVFETTDNLYIVLELYHSY